MTQKTPLIIADPSRSSWSAASFFNPNEWSGQSKGIVMSCWTELGLLFFCRDKIHEVCGKDRSLELCGIHIREIQSQWKTAKFPIDEFEYFAEVPDFHIQIEGFFAASKSLLDMLVQLVASEGIVNGRVHGFHDKGNRILKMLGSNVVKGKESVADSLAVLLKEAKSNWIDQLIEVRDGLIHPSHGHRQIMYQLSFQQVGERLECLAAIPPRINDVSIDQVAFSTVKHLSDFSQGVIRRLHPNG